MNYFFFGVPGRPAKFARAGRCARPQGERVYLTQGALDAVSHWQLLQVPVVAIGSATQFKPQWAECFRGLRPVLVFGADAAGEQATQTVAAALKRVGCRPTRKRLPYGVGEVNERLAAASSTVSV